jgi:acetate kinase
VHIQKNEPRKKLLSGAYYRKVSNGVKILVINSGSSSVKYQLFDTKHENALCKGMVDRIGSNKAYINHSSNQVKNYVKKINVKNHHDAIKHILDILVCPKYGAIKAWADISAIGHRVVHGAEKFREPTVINKGVLNAIERFSELAPLHNPPAVLGIRACLKFTRHMPQVAVFDTAFHHTIPPHAYIYGIPYIYYKKYRIRRYGFHGTSHRFVSMQAARILKKPISQLNLITCHLGNGCSMAAVRNGKSIDTSMGFTPLEGLLMGTRSGDIDPAAVIYIMDKKSLSIKEADDLLNKNSGIFGLSGISNDMRDILKHAQHGNKQAKLTLDVFIYRIVKYIGAYAAVMGSLDAVVLTGGIGENSDAIKKMITELTRGFLKKFKAKLLVVPTNEEYMIAKETAEIVKKKGQVRKSNRHMAQ